MAYIPVYTPPRRAYIPAHMYYYTHTYIHAAPQVCELCPNNTNVARYQDSCVGANGFIVDPDGTVRSCAVDFYCVGNQETAW